MKSACLIVSLIALLALLLVSCESYEPPGVENAGPVGPTSEGYLIPEEPSTPGTTDAVIHRPITDWLAAQAPMSYTVWPFGDVCGWSGHPPGWTNAWAYPYWVYFDWANLVGPWLYDQQGIDLGTEIIGDIMEQSLAGGGRRVHITLKGKNCWTIANICDFGLGPVRWPIVLGYAPEHIFQSGETPLVSECTMNLKWRDDYPVGSDLPNVLYVFAGEGWSTWEGLYIEQLLLFSSSGVGPLTNQPDYEEWGLTPWETGTLGRVMLNQLAINNFATWPSEICNVYPLGNP